MLIGEYEHSLDTKGRMIMPAKLRQDIGEKFIITKGLDGCLFVFSQNEWLNFEEKLKALPLSDKNARNFVRFFLSGATECEIDKQGRFLISANLTRKRCSNSRSWNKIRNLGQRNLAKM